MTELHPQRMADRGDGFDPYRDWLGIQSDSRRPNHYELLGLVEFEEDEDKISAAFEERFQCVRQYEVGRRTEAALRLLGELAEVYTELSDPARKSEYDAALVAASAESPADEVAVEEEHAELPLEPGVPFGLETDATVRDTQILSAQDTVVSEDIISAEVVEDDAEDLSDSGFGDVIEEFSSDSGIASGFAESLTETREFGEISKECDSERRRLDGRDEATASVQEAGEFSRYLLNALHAFAAALLVMPVGTLLVITLPVVLLAVSVYQFGVGIKLFARWFTTEGWRFCFRLLARSVVWGDQLIGRAVGEENKIIHNFLRVVLLLVILISGLGLLGTGGWMVLRGDSSPEQSVEFGPSAIEKLTNSIGMEFVRIEAGKFQMGSDDSGSILFSREKPQHEVRITRPFYMQKTEVTQGQWRAVMGTAPWENERYVKEGSTYPASLVGWTDAQEFCAKLSQQEGKTYRLPTEAEWEYACRAGSTTRYSCGDDETELKRYAWFRDNTIDVGEGYAHEVAKKQPNDFGLYDMHGNVREWCQDLYDENYYAESPVADPRGPLQGSDRVLRGGWWNNGGNGCRSAYRDRDSPSHRSYALGFRVVHVMTGD